MLRFFQAGNSFFLTFMMLCAFQAGLLFLLSFVKFSNFSTSSEHQVSIDAAFVLCARCSPFLMGVYHACVISFVSVQLGDMCCGCICLRDRVPVQRGSAWLQIRCIIVAVLCSS